METNNITNLRTLLAFWEANEPDVMHEDDVAISAARLRSYARHGYIAFVNPYSPFFYMVLAL